MPDLFKSKKAQAATELAIIGSIMILAFSYLISFTAKINMRQELLQEVFTNMLHGGKSDGSDGAAKNGKAHAPSVVFQRLPNILEPYSPGALTPIKSSGKVLWSSGKVKDNQEVKISAKWSADEQNEHGTYHKTFTRTERVGEYPETRRTNDYWGFDAKGEPVRQGP